MPLTFQGGQALPTVGSAAYTAAQQGNGAGSYNASTGVLSANNAPIYNPASVTSPTKASTPVITDQSAQNDYNSKYAAYQQISNQMNQQNAAKASADQIAQQQKAQADLQSSENNLKQQGIDIQKAQAQAQLVDAQAKKDAVSAATGQNNPQQDTTNPANPQTGNAPTDPNQPNTQSPVNPSNPVPDNSGDAIKSATNDYASYLQAIQAQKDQMTQGLNMQLGSLLQGTIPLSAPQQALITSLQTQLSQNVSVQNQANQSYTGSVTEAAFRSGGEYTSQEMQGAISNAVSLGVAKIQELDNSSATTVANLENGFQKQDFDIINQQYGNLMKQLDDKSAAIKDTYSAVTSAIKDQRDATLKQQQFDQTIFKDAQTLKQSNTEFRDAHDQFGNVVGTVVYDKSTGHILSSTAPIDGQGGFSAGAPAPTVQMQSTGAPDQATQQAFLQTIPPQFRQLVTNIANYQQSTSSLSPKTKTQLESWAAQYDPTYDSKQYASRQALMTSFSSGKYSQNKNALNTAIGHIGDLVTNFSKLDNNSNTFNNATVNFVKGNILGQGGVTSAGLNISAATGELASTFKSGGATDQEIKNIGTIGVNSSPEQAKAFIQTSIQLLGSRLQALTDTYTQGMGKPPATSFLSHTNIAALSNLKNQGYQVDIPGVHYTTKDAWDKYGGGNQDTWNKAVDEMTKARLPLTTENILQYAQSN